MIIKIKSKNEYLLDLLNKNPNTEFGLYSTKIRNGSVLGNCVSKNEYEVVFLDSKYSFSDDVSNQVDFQSHCSPLTVLSILNELFRDLLKDKDVVLNNKISWLDKTFVDVDTEKCTIEIPNFYINSSWYRDGQFLLSRYFDGIELNHLIGNNFELKINGNSVFEAINKLALVAMFVYITNRSNTTHRYIENSFVKKYSRILTNLSNVPYFVFYLFIKRCIRSTNVFVELQPKFKQYFKEEFNKDVDFSFFDNQTIRKKYICDRIDFSQPTLDFGCGELQFFKKLNRLGYKQHYYAYDINDYSKLVHNIKSQYGAKNLHWVTDLGKIRRFNGQIILSEVIEHVEKDNVINTFNFLKQIKFTDLFITTPNKDFNIYYEMDSEFRDDDHKFELTFDEFVELIKFHFPKELGYTLNFESVGDNVDGVQPISCVMITRKIGLLEKIQRKFKKILFKDNRIDN